MVNERILVIDDEPTLLELVDDILTSEGYQVTKATSGPQGLSILARERPDLVLLDIMMPRMDGWVVYRKIKENDQTRDIPVAMLTVKSDTIDREIATDIVHVDDYITKPFSPAELVRRVGNLVRRA